MKLILTGRSSPIEYLLLKRRTTLGSAPDADIRLEGDDVSPHHAVIWQNRGMFAIGDWQPPGNVYINGKPAVPGQPLWPGDTIMLGEAQLHFLNDHVTPDSFGPRIPPAEAIESPEAPPESISHLKQLAAIDENTLEKLRQRSPSLKPAAGLKPFLQQGLIQAYRRESKGTFGLVFGVPALFLTGYHTVKARLQGQTVDQAFPEGTWQFYTQFGLREDPARHATETEGFHQAISPTASTVDQAAAWVFQCLTTLFEYESLLENEWIERTLLHLVHEGIAESVAHKLTAARLGREVNPNSATFEAAKQSIWKHELEQVELETEHVKHNLGLSKLDWAWAKKRPYRKPLHHPHETYPQYRRKIFLEFLVQVADKLPAQMGAVIWDRYYDLSSTALPAYQNQMSILYALKPGRHQDAKAPIPLWKAKLGFVAGGRYYLINVAHHDPRGRLLLFKPGKPDDPGEPLTLRQTERGELVDPLGRRITVDRKGNAAIIDAAGNSQIKLLRPTPASLIKAQIAAILHEASVLPPAAAGPDIALAVGERRQQPRLLKRLPRLTQLELEALNAVPIIINWDKQARAATLRQIRAGRRGTGSHALTIFRTESSFVFDQSHIFFDAIWGMVISQIITDGAIETCRLVSGLPQRAANIARPSPLRLTDNPAFQTAAKPYLAPFEVTAETKIPDLSVINTARQYLARLNIPATVNDLLTIYRAMHDQRYAPGLDLQRALTTFRLAGRGSLVDQIEKMWQNRQREPVSLLLPMDASFVNPKLRLYPATFKNFLPDLTLRYETTATLLNQYLYTPSPEVRQDFMEARNLLLAYLLVLTRYFAMLKHITRQGESLSTAAIKYLAHLPAGVQGTLDAIPQHIGALNEIIKGEEVFSNVGRVSPASSLVRFMSAKDDGRSKVMVWGIMCDSRGDLKITLRDFRPHVAQLLKLGQESLAQLMTQDYLEAYAAGLNQFAEDLTQIVKAGL